MDALKKPLALLLGVLALGVLLQFCVHPLL